MHLNDLSATGRILQISVCWLVSGYNRVPSSHGRCSKEVTSSSSTASSTTPAPTEFSSTLASTMSSLTSAGPPMTISSSTASSTDTRMISTSPHSSSTTPVPSLVGCCQNSTLIATSNGSVCKVLLVRQCLAHSCCSVFDMQRPRLLIAQEGPGCVSVVLI